MSELDSRDVSRLRDMFENAHRAREFTKGKSRADLDNDSLLAYGVIFALQIIGEAANHISENTRASIPDIEWLAIIGMRNRVVHGYNDISLDVVWATVQEKLPPLIETLRKTLLEAHPDLDQK